MGEKLNRSGGILLNLLYVTGLFGVAFITVIVIAGLMLILLPKAIDLSRGIGEWEWNGTHGSP